MDIGTDFIVDSAHTPDNSRTLDALVNGRYDELAGKARRLLQRERASHTLQTCALIHEAYLRMRGLCETDWRDRARFLPIAVGIMRRVLVDHARCGNAYKRGGDLQRVSLDNDAIPAPASIDVLDLDHALARLADHDPVQARIVEHRFFGGLTISQIGSMLDLSPATVKRKWTMAQAWLYRELNVEANTPGTHAQERRGFDRSRRAN